MTLYRCSDLSDGSLFFIHTNSVYTLLSVEFKMRWCISIASVTKPVLTEHRCRGFVLVAATILKPSVIHGAHCLSLLILWVLWAFVILTGCVTCWLGICPCHFVVHLFCEHDAHYSVLGDRDSQLCFLFCFLRFKEPAHWVLRNGTELMTQLYFQEPELFKFAFSGWQDLFVDLLSLPVWVSNPPTLSLL